MITINGIGTKIYGKKNKRPDGSHITTKWFTFFFLPIIPISSHRVKNHEKNDLMQVKYYFLEDLPLDKTQIIKTYGIALLCVAIFVLFIFFAS